ncbi:hypothetical protein BKA63DRAFT_494274 [Paraphoma chrysanthemicola]|nr:hypothetical protein BKA63DRAFT_494274 [Paraphoma chrysanthemicola]
MAKETPPSGRGLAAKIANSTKTAISKTLKGRQAVATVNTQKPKKDKRLLHSRAVAVAKARKINPLGVRVLDAKFTDTIWVAQYANFEKNANLTDLVTEAVSETSSYLHKFVQSAANKFDAAESHYPQRWIMTAKTELFSYAKKSKGITEEDIEQGCPMDATRWPLSQPRERIVASFMVTMLRLLRTHPEMNKGCEQWWPGDLSLYLQKYTYVDGISHERLHAAFCVLRYILQETSGKRGDRKAKPKLNNNRELESVTAPEELSLESYDPSSTRQLLDLSDGRERAPAGQESAGEEKQEDGQSPIHAPPENANVRIGEPVRAFGNDYPSV